MIIIKQMKECVMRVTFKTLKQHNKIFRVALNTVKPIDAQTE